MNEGNHDTLNMFEFRKLMVEHGLREKRWMPGYIEPNEPKTERKGGPEDFAINFMAHGMRDRLKVGAKRVSDAELKFYHRKTDFCSWTCPDGKQK